MITNMEEVDGIIIHTLKTIGCDIEDDVQSLCQFTTELTVEATALCIKTIRNDMDVPHKLPPSMSARFRVGTSLAKALQDLGYKGDVGYQTFLYSNEADLRRVFIFLVEKLPKESSTAQEEALGPAALLQRAIGAELRRRLGYPWTPPFCKQGGIAWSGEPPQWHREGVCGMHHIQTCPITMPKGLHDITRKIPKDLKKYYKSDLPLVHCQPVYSHQVPVSILEANAKQITAQMDWEAEWNQQGLASRLSPEEYKARKKQRIEKRISDQMCQSIREAKSSDEVAGNLDSLLETLSSKNTAAPKVKGSRFTHAEKLQFSQDSEKTSSQIGVGEGPRVDSEEDMQRKREEEITELKQELLAITNQLEVLQLDIRKSQASQQQMEEQVLSTDRSNKEKADNYKIQKKTIDLVPDAENNIAKLQEMMDASGQKLVKLAGQWETHRAPLIAQYRELRELSNDKQSEVEQKLTDIQELRERMKEATVENKSKDDVLKQLRSDYGNMAKDVNRSAYTRRILEIVANIKKQKEQIDRVLIDTKSIQKEINQLSGKLDRTFTVTDELVFKDAKKDETVRKSYKYLAALHQNCSSVIQTVEETGFILREIRDLEDQVEQESKKNIIDNLERITSDYQAMKKENSVLVSKLKRQSTS